MDDTQRTGWQKRILLFLTSQCITLFGSTLVQMALVWYATMQTSSGVWVAAFTVCSYLPQFLISFIGGVWADRYHRKKLIIGADICRHHQTRRGIQRTDTLWRYRQNYPLALRRMRE